MANKVSFYHFNTEEAMNSATNLKDTDIAFCKETKVIKTHGVEYGRALEWEELGAENEPESQDE